MKYKSVLIIMVLAMSQIAKAQDFSLKELPISVGYYGENAIHPGLKIGTSYTFHSKEKSKTYRFKGRQNKFGDKRKLKELSLDYNLGFYSHPNNHTGYFSNVGFTYLRTKLRKNRQFGLSLEIGYLRRANKFKTYELDANGKPNQLKFAGHNATVIAISPVFGKEFADNSIRFFVKPSLQMITYNHTWLPNATAEMGLVFNINRK